MSGWPSACTPLSSTASVYSLGQRVVDRLLEHGRAPDPLVDDARGTLPGRKPGMRICDPISLYAVSRLGFSSSKGTSTASRTRVGLRFSTVLFTVLMLLGGASLGGSSVGGRRAARDVTRLARLGREGGIRDPSPDLARRTIL